MMHVTQQTEGTLEDVRVSVKVKLGALWATMMFLYIYVDYFHLYMPGSIEHLMAGQVWEFEISQVFLLAALVSVTIPAIMIFLAAALPAKANRLANIIVGAIYIPFTLFNLVGEAWLHMIFGAVVEVALLSLIIWYAWKWPRFISNREQVKHA